MYVRKQDSQVFYVLLGKLPAVPVGNTGTIPQSMLQHAEDFVGAAFDTSEEADDGSLWWYVNKNSEGVPQFFHFDLKPFLIVFKHNIPWNY